MRYQNFAEKEYYHVFARGVNGQKIFLDEADKARFIFLITHLQSPIRVYNIGWYTQMFLRKKTFSTKKERLNEILKDRHVELAAFAIMPNHFHLLVKNLEDQILSVYMHRVLTAYGKYFNAKYNKKGHVFEGPFNAVHVDDNNQLLYLSAYIHKNPKDIKEWENSYNKYPYSSYQDYISTNRWGNLISPDIILNQFKDQTAYDSFVKESVAKEKPLYDFDD